MRILVVSDIHSNLVALETVFAAVGSVDAVWCLGDTIGYGPAPNECVALMQARASVAILGNHDLASLGALDLSDFNPDARKANIWNGEQLADEQRAYLQGLQPAAVVDERFVMAHGSPREPVWEYLLHEEQVLDNFALFDTQVCLIGHSHIPLIFQLDADGTCTRSLPGHGARLDLADGVRYFINPGSVGQPRDHDPRAAYAIIDGAAGVVRFFRVEYDIARTQRHMRQAELPAALWRRLEVGM
jgi:diadenosine tetraphosphatase ApaH/serine/threonine PP2A family protein phosphatase